MKKYLCKKVICFVVLLLLWIFPSIPRYVTFEDIICLIIFTLSIISVYAFKNAGVGFAVLAALTVGISFYRYEYLFLALPPILLIAAHRQVIVNREETKNRRDGVSGIYVTFCYMASLVQIAYTFIQDKDIKEWEFSNSLVNNLGCFFIIIILLIIHSYSKDFSKKEKNMKSRIEEIRRIYFATLFALTVATCSHALIYGIHVIAKVRIGFVYWFVFLAAICINEDLVFKSAANSLEKKLNNTVFESVKRKK